MLHIKLAQFAVRCALPPRRSESPVCSTDNKPSCVLHLLGWFIGSRGFSSLDRRPEFWVLHFYHSYYLRIYEHFKNPVLWTGTKINYIFLIINNKITQGKARRHRILPSVGFSAYLSGQGPAESSRVLLALGRGRKEEHPLLLWTLRFSCFCCLILLLVYSL